MPASAAVASRRIIFGCLLSSKHADNDSASLSQSTNRAESRESREARGSLAFVSHASIPSGEGARSLLSVPATSDQGNMHETPISRGQVTSRTLMVNGGNMDTGENNSPRMPFPGFILPSASSAPSAPRISTASPGHHRFSTASPLSTPCQFRREGRGTPFVSNYRTLCLLCITSGLWSPKSIGNVC